MTYILSIETSGKTCSVALGKDEHLITSIEIHPEGFSHAEKLNLFIQEIISRNEIAFSDLKAICISAGPGSYTGLRIGTATAKGLCYGLGIPLISIDSLQIMFAKYIKENASLKTDYYIPMIDARRMEVFQSIYDNTHNCIKKPFANIIDEQSFESLDGAIQLFGDGADKLENLDFSDRITIQKGFKTSSEAMVTIAYHKYKNKEFEDLAYFDPLYVKEFQAG